MAGQGTIGTLFDALVDVLRPLGAAVSSPDRLDVFLQRFGLVVPTAGLAPAANNLAPLRDLLATLARERVTFDDAKQGGGVKLEDLLAFGDKVIEGVNEARALPDRLAALGRSLPAELPGEILDVLVASYLANYHEPVYRVGVLLGLIDQRVVPGGGGSPEARDVDYVQVTLRWDRVGTLFTDPAGLATDVYGWHTEGFDTDQVVVRLQRLFAAFGIIARTDDMDRDALVRLYPSAAARAVPPQQLRMPLYTESGAIGTAEMGLLLTPIGGTTGTADAGLGLLPYAEGTLTLEIPLADTLTLTVGGHAAFAGGIAATVRPSGFRFETGIFDTTKPIDDFKVELTKGLASDATSIVLLGDPEPGSRLDCSALVLGVGGGAAGFYIAGGVRGLRVVVRAEQDGLLHTLLPEGLTVEGGDIVLGWRPGRGVYFEGGAGLRVILPVDIELGPVAITKIAVRFDFVPDIAMALLVDASLTIGPLFLGAQGLGIGVKLVPKQGGAFGNVDLQIGLVSPTGYAAALDAGPITGGGAIFVTDTGYMGALALGFEAFSFSAFAILTTKLPSGQPGYSFLATIFATFEIQLGYGFKLTGLGGLIGIHRTMQLEPLRNVLRAGNLDGLLFPSDPIADAARILHDMETVFPAREGQFVFGPMVRIAWGTPTLIEGTLGVIVELGGSIRIAILGRLRAALPTADSAVVVLGIDFLGAIDFDARSISFDATLINSRILDWPISGEMALRTGWGEHADFVFSVGGFHPQFPVPTGFPSLRRLTINFGSNDPRVTLTAYMALTLNTAQIGARLELYVSGPDIVLVGKFEVDGYAYFDALLQFSPFAFDAALGLGLSLLRNGEVCCAIGGDLRLRGPNPYWVRGRVWAEVLGIEVKVVVERTFGQPVEEPPLLTDALALVLAAAQERSYWEPTPALQHRSGVGFAKRGLGGESGLVVDPVGGLRFAQRAVPLGIAIERLGTARLANEFRTFGIRPVDAAGAALPATETRGQFATGQFFDLSDDERLAAPPTEEYTSGFALATADQLEYPVAAVPMTCDYETLSMLDYDAPSKSLGTHALPGSERGRWTSELRETVRPRHSHYIEPALAAGRVTVKPDDFVVASDQANARGLVPLAGPATFAAQRAARAVAGAGPSPGGSPVLASFLADPDALGRAP